MPPMDVVRYVIVVHGIGQQRKNESVRPVIERFAQARSQSGRQIGNPITLGLMASHLREAPIGAFTDALEEGWIEFEGIPQRPDVEREPPFVGRAATEPGHNLRFVDLHWSSVMDDQFGAFGESAGDWTRSLIDRLEIREAPSWIRQLLRTMRNGVLPLQAWLRRRNPDVTEEIFDRFLGDVQLYGEYQATRGMAMRRLHERLARLEADHYAAEARTGRVPRDPRYVVIGHSLGSVMSFDALLFAHMKRSGDHRAVVELLPEYGRNPSTKQQDGQLPNLEWIRNVDALVTLGSPIDKFLVMWWLNYAHLVPPADWVDPELLKARGEPGGRIPHYNYCDEQDPVGHNLDVAYSKGALVEQIFEKKEDVVYTRYATPGVAHVDYWKDGDLFQRILDQAVDGRSAEEATPVAWFKWWTYVQSLAWTYLLVPVLGWLAATGAMMWAVNGAQNFGTRMFWVLASLGVLLLACWLMRLMVEWREVVIAKGRDTAALFSPGQRVARWVLQLAFRTLVVVVPVVWMYLLIAAIASMQLPEPVGWIATRAHDWRLAIDTWLPDTGLLTWAGKLVASVGALRPLAALGGAFKPFVDVWQANKTTLALIASVFGFLIGVWNLLVFARIRWLYRHGAEPLDFVHYVNDDPTRPTRRSRD